MELVEGVPVTDYCDAARLSPRERLELFLPVCAAVQHAHQKGIIHRDLKPSNVLVTVFDGRPVPKVIDFGVAKAVDQRRAERTLFTRLGAIVGTPEYMSPEQAGAGPDVDTRTDVYSLGVLLYELLTGTTPLDRETLRRAAFDEVLKRIREEEPPRPSTRLSATNDRLPSVAAVRGTEPGRLWRLVRGDLDWVVMKALDKDRSCRYETPSAFARDVQRHLDGDPVEAGPPSRVYRLRKFARKHRAGLSTAAAFALVLIAATTVSTWEAWRATRAERVAEQRLGEVRRANAATTSALSETKKAQAVTQAALKQSEEARAQAEAVRAFLTEAFRSPDPGQDGRQVKVADLLDRAVEKLDKEFTGSAAVRGALLNALGETYFGLGLYDKAIETFGKACTLQETSLGPDHPDTLVSRNNLGNAYREVGRTQQAIALLESTLALMELRLGAAHPTTLITRHNLAEAYRAAGRTTDAIRMHKETLRLKKSKLGPDHPSTLNSRNSLAGAYFDAGQTSEAIRRQEEALRLSETKLGPDHPSTLASRNSLATFYATAYRIEDAVRMHEETLKVQESNLGPYHPHTLLSRINLANAYRDAGRVTEAIRMHEETLVLMESKLGPDYPGTLFSRESLAAAYWKAGRLERSVPLFEKTLRQYISQLGPEHPTTLLIQANLGVNYRDAGRLAEGVTLMEDAFRRAGARSNALSKLAWVPVELAKAYDLLGQSAKAEPLYRDALKRARESFGPDDPRTAGAMALLGFNLLKQEKWTEAESVLRECLAVREKTQPGAWNTFNTRSLLGGALLGQGTYAEAEPLIVSGYEGLKARAATIPSQARDRLTEAAVRGIRLYEAWGKPEQATAWKERLGLADLPADVFTPP
jgi:tetratricopeptide (TPR) repeat protein